MCCLRLCGEPTTDTDDTARDDTAQDDSPPPVQPVTQPTTNVAINNNAGFQPPHQQVNRQIEFKCTHSKKVHIRKKTEIYDI